MSIATGEIGLEKVDHGMISLCDTDKPIREERAGIEDRGRQSAFFVGVPGREEE